MIAVDVIARFGADHDAVIGFGECRHGQHAEKIAKSPICGK